MAGAWRTPSRPSPLPALADHSLLTVAVGVRSVSSDGSADLSLSLPSHHPLILLQPASASTYSSHPAPRSALLTLFAMHLLLSPPSSGSCFFRYPPRSSRAPRPSTRLFGR